MARQPWTWIALAASVLLVPDAIGQVSDPSVTQNRATAAALDRLANDRWHPWEREPAWLDLRRALSEELTRRPGGPLAARARLAAAYVDVAIGHVVAQRNEELSIQVDVNPRFQFDVPIPYVAEVYGSLDGGEWFRLGVFLAGHGCGAKLTTTSIWPAQLRDGFHHLDVLTDISFLRAPLRTDEVPTCDIPKRERAQALPDVSGLDVIQRERRVLPGVSFGIFSDLLGAPTALVETLEAGLPPVPITRWLNEILASVPGTAPESAGPWFSDFCEPEESVVFVGLTSGSLRRPQSARPQSRAVCLTLLPSLPDGRLLALSLRVGTVNEDTGNWSIEPPSIREVSIGRSGNVLDVPFLSMLPNMLTFTPEAFPPLDVSIEPWDIRYEPFDAKPGDPITITATIRNLGDHDAPFTSGMLAVMSCCDSNIPIREFVEHIPAGGHVIVSLQTTMPLWGCVGVNILPWPANALMRQGPYGQIRDANSENNDAVIEIGTTRPEALAPCHS